MTFPEYTGKVSYTGQVTFHKVPEKTQPCLTGHPVGGGQTADAFQEGQEDPRRREGHAEGHQAEVEAYILKLKINHCAIVH